MKIFAERLKLLREEKGISQQELALEIGSIVTRSAIGYYELGRRVPGFDAVIAIAKYFGVTTDYLAGLED